MTRHKTKWLATVLIVLSCIVVALSAYVYLDQSRTRPGLERVIQIGCQFDKDFASGLRGLIINSRDRITSLHKMGQYTAKQYEDALKQNERILKVVTVPDCEARLREL